jgi:PKD repeat protein
MGINFEGGLAPVADFSGDPLTGSNPLEVNFTDESTGSPTTWLWEKNDGGGWVDFDGDPTVQDPVEIFGIGTWDVRLTACNLDGCDTKTQTDYVTVESVVLPVAAFSGTPLAGCAV